MLEKKETDAKCFHQIIMTYILIQKNEIDVSTTTERYF